MAENQEDFPQAIVRERHVSPSPGEQPDRLVRLAALGAVLSALVSVAVCVGATSLRGFLTPPEDPMALRRGTDLDRLCGWDGQWYRRICSRGYAYAPGEQSSVVFFPAYPLTARMLCATTGIAPELALVLISNATCVIAAALLGCYSYQRQMGGPAPWRVSIWTMVWFLVFPTSMFYHMGYSESLFALAVVAVAWGMHEEWPAILLALCVGLATAIRPVGISLVPALLWHTCIRRRTIRPRGTSFVQMLGEWCLLFVAGSWGILSYMLFQWCRFGNPVVFALGQSEWHNRPPASSWWQAVRAVCSFEPVRAVYQRGSACYWGSVAPFDDPILNIRFFNPVLFVAMCVTIAVGWRKRWISVSEVLVGGGLLSMAYVTQSYRMCMQSQGRFAAVVVPAYLVLGTASARLPGAIMMSLAGVSAAMMFLYAVLFVSGYQVL